MNILRTGRWATRLLLIVAVAAGGSVIASGCSKLSERESFSPSKRYAEFVAGFSLLTTANKHLSDSLKMQRFRELTMLTGLPADSVVSFLGTLRDDPEQGKKFYTQMSRLYENRSDTLTR